jgi:hypothetical protein
MTLVGRAGRRVPHDHRGQVRQFGQQRFPPGELGCAVEHGHAHLAVGRHVPDLVGRERGVERDWNATGVQHRLVGEHVLHPVRQHQGDPVTRLKAEPDQAGGEPQHLVAELLPGHRLPGGVAAPVGVGRLVAVLCRRLP